jgi:hypothetical protein
VNLTIGVMGSTGGALSPAARQALHPLYAPERVLTLELQDVGHELELPRDLEILYLTGDAA